MSTGFGWSIGDVVLLAKTIHRIHSALNHATGASFEYRNDLASLTSLQTTLQEVRNILSTAEPIFRNAIQGQLNTSTSSIADYRKKLLDKYGKALCTDTPKNHGIWKKISWTLSDRDALHDFRVQLSEQLDTVKLLIISDLWQSTKTSTVEISTSQTMILEILTMSKSNSTQLAALLEGLGALLGPGIEAIKHLSDTRDTLSRGIQEYRRTVVDHLDDQFNCFQATMDQNNVIAREQAEITNDGLAIMEDHLNHIRKTQAGSFKDQAALAQSVGRIQELLQNIHTRDDNRERRPSLELTKQFLDVKQGVDEIKTILFENIISTIQVQKNSNKVAVVGQQEIKAAIFVLCQAGIKSILRLLNVFKHCIIHFLRVIPRLFLLLQTMPLIPLRALGKQKKDLICFEDFLGNVRWLDITYFRHLEVLEAFLRNDYKGKPGGKKIAREEYILKAVSSCETITVTERNWDKIIIDSLKLILSIVINRWESDTDRCPTCDKLLLETTKVASSNFRSCECCRQNYYMSEVDDWGIPKQRRPGESTYGPLPYRELSFTETYDNGGTELRYFKHLGFAYPDTLHPDMDNFRGLSRSLVKPCSQAGTSLLLSDNDSLPGLSEDLESLSTVHGLLLQPHHDDMYEIISAEDNDGLYPSEISPNSLKHS